MNKNILIVSLFLIFSRTLFAYNNSELGKILDSKMSVLNATKSKNLSLIIEKLEPVEVGNSYLQKLSKNNVGLVRTNDNDVLTLDWKLDIAEKETKRPKGEYSLKIFKGDQLLAENKGNGFLKGIKKMKASDKGLVVIVGEKFYFELHATEMENILVSNVYIDKDGQIEYWGVGVIETRK